MRWIEDAVTNLQAVGITLIRATRPTPPGDVWVRWPLPSLDDGHCGQVVEERLCDPSPLVLGQAVGDRRHLARASHRRRREHELDEVRLGVRPCEQGEVPRVDLLRSGGRVRAFATSAEVGDSRWKEFLIGDRC